MWEYILAIVIGGAAIYIVVKVVVSKKGND